MKLLAGLLPNVELHSLNPPNLESKTLDWIQKCMHFLSGTSGTSGTLDVDASRGQRGSCSYYWLDENNSGHVWRKRPRPTRRFQRQNTAIQDQATESHCKVRRSTRSVP